jgi:hypothetical protein
MEETMKEQKTVNINLNDYEPESCADCESTHWLPTFNIRRIPGMLVAAKTDFVNHEMPAPICAKCGMSLRDSVAKKDAELKVVK